MIWLPVFGILGVVFAIQYTLDESESLPGAIIRGIITTPLFSAVGILAGVVAAFVIGIFSLFLPKNEITVSEIPIYSVSDESGVNGRFVLGTGTVNSDLNIYYVAETEAGKEIKKVKADAVSIVEDDDKTPNAKVVGERLKWKWIEWFMLDLNELFDKTVLTVPVGTTTTEYNIDLK